VSVSAGAVKALSIRSTSRYAAMTAARRWLIGAIILAAFAGCDDNQSSPKLATPFATPPPPKIPTNVDSLIVFSSGRGTGQYDTATYAKYSSSILLTPQTDMTVTGIRPQVWYNNGASGFLSFIRGAHYEYLEAEAGLADGTGYDTPKFLDRHLEEPLTLKAGTTYLIEMEVWTTKSIGIYTTGSRTSGVIGSANYSVQSASMPDRGGIAFELVN